MRIHGSRTPFTKTLNSGLLGLTLLGAMAAGCSSTAATVQQKAAAQPQGSVRLEEVADWEFEASHPSTIALATLDSLLRGVMISDAQTDLSNLPVDGSKPMKVFSDEDVHYLAPLLAQALSQAQPEYVVAFRLSSSAGSGSEPTAGTLYVQNERLYLTVTEHNGTLAKVERKSPTLGAKPPAGATVLFDGSSAEAFENGELIEGNLLGATNCFSKERLNDHQLHVEFRTPFMPAARGQGRGNSGVYVQGRYEVQVLDSFGLEGRNNECGGIYSISEPIVNMCLPPLSWQTYDIDFTAARYDGDGKKIKNARATIELNGVVIHDDLELTHGTPGYHAEGPEPESLFLQNHGNPVAVRNIWIVKK